MPRQRKIKHYSYGYRSRRKRRGKVMKVILFLLLLAGLIFLGYCAAKSIGDLSSRDRSLSESESSVIAEPENSLPVSEPSESEPEEESTETAAALIRAVLLPADTAADPQLTADFLQELDPDVYNTVVVELKDDTGALAYQSAVPLASSCGAVQSGAMTLEELSSLAQTIESAGFVPAAQIYTLKDDLASHATYQTSYLYQDQEGVTWLDQAAAKGGRSWLNPYMPAAVEYLESITAEISAAGFTTIFAAGLQYPETKYPQQMGYGPNSDSMDLTEALQAALDSITSAAAAEGAEVIPVYLGECYLGENETFYNGSPDNLVSDLAAPVLTAGREAEILAAIRIPAEKLVPIIQESLLSLVQEAGIEQYLTEP